MKLIDWLIKKLVNYKYKKDPFLAWSWPIDDYTDIKMRMLAMGMNPSDYWEV